MTESTYDRHMAENEVVFRRYNESIEKSLKDMRRLAREHGQEHLLGSDDMTLHFYCECSNESCLKRVVAPLHEYSKIHKKRNYFMIYPGHQRTQIEKVVTQFQAYAIVEKYIVPSEAASVLHKTNL